MARTRFFPGAVLLAAFVCSSQPGAAEVYPLILRGKVTMQDGSPPPKSVGIQRLCSDGMGSAPGPITNAKGEFTWRMEVDPMRTRVCRLEATLAGYTSTSIDISSLNGYTSTTFDLAPIVLHAKLTDPLTISNTEADVPGKAKNAWKAAMKGVDSGDLAEAEKQLQAVVQAAPKFGRGWHTLGIVYQTLGKLPEAQQAYTSALDADPKFVQSYAASARLAIKSKDWAGAAKTADAGVKADVKKTFPELWLHQAVARYGAKDLDGAEAAAKEALQQKVMRAEFVLGRIAAAKGDAAGAREHVSKYLELEPGAADAEIIRAYLQVVGKPEGAGVDPDLELP
jgi:Tfp pilus assembly protein PilF